MQESPFKIFNASAGSGKTYALTKAYLKLVLVAPNSFKRILAITFTNKAVNEMKHRILNSLHEFSTVNLEIKPPSLFKELLVDLKLTPESLKQLSKLRLKEILHNYAFFDISTIDKFTHRLIRTFARDLKIPQNFEVVLDTDLLLNEAVSRVIGKAGEDKELTKILMAFALEKIDDDKSWDITYDLLKIGKLLFDENNVPHIKLLEGKDIYVFLKLQENLFEKITEKQKRAVNIAKETLNYIESTGLEFTDFPREILPNHFKKVREGVLNPSLLYANKLEENLIEGKIVKANIQLPDLSIPDELLQRYLDIKEDIYSRSLLLNVYKNIVPLTLLNSIQTELKLIQEEKNQLSISEFNSIISKKIRNQPAPFIYERLGEKYRHYFIDEFQDTSEMQWNNLIPLISNALEGLDSNGLTGSLFLVGDAKQAIYRWRGGKAEQFLDLTTKNNQPFSVPVDVHLLPKNYRSEKEIITFNNLFFQSISTFLENETYQQFFREGNQQQTNHKKEGYVNLSFLEEETDENYAEKTLSVVNQNIENGFNYGDICILVRKKKHGILISDFLLNSGVPVISPDALLLSNNKKVRFLVNLMRFKRQPDENAISYEILSFLSEQKEDRHSYIQENLTSLNVFLQKEFSFYVDRFIQESIYDGIEYALKTFDLTPISDAHVTAFLDIVFEVEQKKGPDLQYFLDYWEKKGDTLSISTPDKMNAVQVMTIHKAKGLEFPVVIFPYANTYILEEIDPKLWIPVEQKDFLGFKELLIDKKQEVKMYGNQEAYIYEEEEHKLVLDSFNLLYVALTRTVSSLYIISYKDLEKNGGYKTKYFSGLFIHFLSTLELWNPEKLEYEFGRLNTNNKDKKSELHSNSNIPYIYTHKDRSSFRIMTKAGMLWESGQDSAIDQGNVIHYVLGNIKDYKDLDNAVLKSIRKGFIDEIDAENVKVKINAVLNHPKLVFYYKEGNIIYNEKDILLVDGTIERPDRVVVNDDGVTIIDYKTGKKNSRYQEQIETYANAYISMGYRVENKIIVYINENIVTEFI